MEKEGYRSKIKRLCWEYGTYQTIEKKQGYILYNDDTEWDLTQTKYWGTIRKRNYSSDKRLEDLFEEKLNSTLDELLNKIFKNAKDFDDYKKKIRKFIFQEVYWGFHKRGKKKPREWDDRKKEYSRRRKAYGKLTLIGEKLKVNIMAIIYDIITSIIIVNYNILLYNIYNISNGEYSLIKKTIKNFSHALRILEKDSDFQKCKKRLEKIYQQKYPKEYFNLNKVDVLLNKYKEEGFYKLFKADIKRLPIGMRKPAFGLGSMLKQILLKSHVLQKVKAEEKKKLKEQQQEAIKEYSKNVGVEGFNLTIRIIDSLERRNKVRRGLGGACTYLLSKVNYVEGFWVFPVDSHSAWARLYEMDKEKFRDRVNEVKSSNGWKEYILERASSFL